MNLKKSLRFTLLPASYAIAKCDKNLASAWPVSMANLLACIIEADCISYIAQQYSPLLVGCENSNNWRALKIDAVLDFSQSGVLLEALTPLAAANISVLVVSSFDTDYILVQQLSAQEALRVAGHQFTDDN
ncbi:MAG: ACT domain-containing protein [Glaciimonas sp.]|nr:ACT domain-containing protein [Glaciimonas sp.]